MSNILKPRVNYRSIDPDNVLDWDSLGVSLSDFQLKKLSFLFTSFFGATSTDGCLEEINLTKLGEKLNRMAGWNIGSKDYVLVKDFVELFFECLLDHVKVMNITSESAEELSARPWAVALKPRKMTVDQVSLRHWLNLWAKLCTGAAGMDDFPIWVQLIPEVMFRVGAQGDPVMSRDQLRTFYINFSGMKTGPELEATVEEGYRTMTANGDYKLDLETFKLLFSNFLLGKTIYGPGKFIFGCFDNHDMREKYQIIYE